MEYLGIQPESLNQPKQQGPHFDTYVRILKNLEDLSAQHKAIIGHRHIEPVFESDRRDLEDLGLQQKDMTDHNTHGPKL